MSLLSPTKRVRRSRPAARQRGSVLVLVMGVSAVVGVIGLSSLLAVRLQHRDAESRADAAQAQILADSALRVVHQRLVDDPDWRSGHTHDTWTTAENLGLAAAMRYKLVDQEDTDLDNDDQHQARLVVRVAHGDAVRLASVMLGGGSPLGPELTTNGGMELGNAGYTNSYGSGNFNIYSDSPHSGNNYLQFENRSAYLATIKQDLANDALVSGKTYRVSMWVRLEDSADDVRIGLYQSQGFSFKYEEDKPACGTDWTLLSADFTPDFSFDPTTVYVYSLTDSGSQDMHFDDISVREVYGESPPIVRGSYRRELDN